MGPKIKEYFSKYFELNGFSLVIVNQCWPVLVGRMGIERQFNSHFKMNESGQ